MKRACIYCVWCVNCYDFKLSISRMHFVCFRFCLLELVGHCLWEKQHHDAIHTSSRNLETAYCLAFMPEMPIWRFQSVWASIWEHYRGFKKSWIRPMIIMKVQQLRNLTLIVQTRKELTNLLLRFRPWLSMIPAIQSGL